jgi:phosphopantothenoylcysteine decarboxylase/phosphopantothenate--cysteine ligase
VIAAAAVSDYRPENTFDQKKKKSNSNWELKLVKTKDILLSLGQSKTSQILVGFALETENELENAQKKLSKKNLDLIVLNSLNDKEAGFQKDTNKIQLISKENVKSFSAKAKIEVASDIIQELIPRL